KRLRLSHDRGPPHPCDVTRRLPAGDASGWRGMLVVETIGRIRREHFVKGKSIKEIGKDRQFNRGFLRMCGHYLVEPTACTPAAGWEKGQVENQVGLVRERFFTPRLRVASYEELNAWLLDQCVAYAKAHRHPELADRTIWQAFEAERSQLVP